MKILIIGFHRSGTTLLRRIFQVHPQIRKILHESFLLFGCSTKKQVINYIENKNINAEKENWGEKIPYSSVSRKGISAVEYCRKWNEYFGDDSRIIHIIRHPYDVSFSVIKKEKNINEFNNPLAKYVNYMRKSVLQITAIPNTFTVKYEKMLLNPDITIPALYGFCGLDPSIDFNKYLSKLKNRRYQKINSSRAFAYKDKEIKSKIDCTNTFKLLNQIDGPKYEEV